MKYIKLFEDYNNSDVHKENIDKLNNLLVDIESGSMSFNLIDISEIRQSEMDKDDIETKYYIELANDIKENGVIPLLLNDKTYKYSNGKYTIWDGNHRFQILKKMGIKKIPAYIHKGDINEDGILAFLDEYTLYSPLYKFFFRADGSISENYSGEQQEYIDIISMDPDKYGKYKPKLKTLGVDFDDIYKDVFYIENASLDNIKTKTDFLNFDNYIKYAKKIFHLRKLSSPNHIDKELTLSEVENIGSKLGFDVVYKKYTGEGNYASHFLGKIAMDKTIDVNTLIHELGHHFEFISKYEGLANTITYASSPYFIGKKDEVFAENFMHYFIAPKWLKQNLPEVFQELDQKITPEYKTIIREL